MCGLSSPAIQKKLFSEADLTLDKAVSTAVSMEMTDKGTGKFKIGPDVENKQPAAANELSVTNKECFHCGKTNHNQDF